MLRFGRRKFLSTFLILAALVIHSAAAAAVSFQIIQHDSSVDTVRQSSYVMENVFFDSFFDSGHITTNFPTAISKSEAGDKAVYFRSLDEAKNTYCNYLVVLMIDYDTTSSASPEAVLLSNIKGVSWILYNARTGAEIERGSKKVEKVSDNKNNERGVKELTRSIASDIVGAVPKS